MRDIRNFLLLTQNTVPGEAFSDGLASAALVVHDRTAHTLAVKLNRHPDEENETPWTSFAAGTEAAWNDASDTIDLASLELIEGRRLAVGMLLRSTGAFDDVAIDSFAEASIVAAANSTAAHSTEPLEIMLPPWTPSTEEATIIVYAVLPPLTEAERHPLDDSTERLLELERTTMTLADLASKGWGRSEGLCAYDAVKVKIECSSTEWPFYGQLVVWGMTNNQR